MRIASLALALTLAFANLPAFADETQGQMVTLKADQIGQIFCMSRTGNDEAVIEGILTDDLGQAIQAAEKKDDDYVRKYPDDKPPLGDGVPWQSAPDYAAKCEIGLVTLSKTDARVEIKYGFPEEPAADFTDSLILKRIPIEGMNVGYWRIDDVIYPDGTDLKGALVSAFDGVE